MKEKTERWLYIRFVGNTTHIPIVDQQEEDHLEKILAATLADAQNDKFVRFDIPGPEYKLHFLSRYLIGYEFKTFVCKPDVADKQIQVLDKMERALDQGDEWKQ